MKRCLGVITLLFAIATTTAFAETQCPVTEGDVVLLRPPEDDMENFFSGLAVSFLLGLSPGSFPKDNIASADNACVRGRFEIGNHHFVVFGADDNSPPRWAIGDQADQIAFLALMPPPAVALAWAQSANRQNEMSFTEPPVFALAVTRGDKRDIFAVLESIPGDAELIALFRDALSGASAPFASYNTSTGQTEAVPE